MQLYCIPLADYGARPLKRAIQHELQDPLAVKILSGDFHEGEVIHVKRGKKGLEFTALPSDNLMASYYLPQVAETDTPRLMDAAGPRWLYHKIMICEFTEKRSTHREETKDAKVFKNAKRNPQRFSLKPSKSS